MSTTPLFPLGQGLLPVDLEAGASLTLSWVTDVMKSLSGKEQRVSNRAKPQQSYTFSCVLDDAHGRALLSQLARYQHTAPTWRLPLPWEGLQLTSSSSTTITFPSLASCDWAVTGQPIAVRHPSGTWAETIIASVAGPVLTVDDNITATGIGGALALPVMPVVLQPETGFSRYPTRAGRVNMTAVAAVNKLGDGTMGRGVTLATYDGFSVWDPGIDADGTVSQPIEAGGSVLNAGLVQRAMAAYSRSDWKRALRIASSNPARWGFLKKFLDTVVGNRVSFLAPTGRPDLVPITDASSGVLRVASPPTANAPDYINDWYPSLAHRRLRLVKADGTYGYRKVTSTADNGGSQDLTLDSSFAGALSQVEFLETVRLDGDVSVAWSSQGFESTPQALVVQR